MAHGSHPVLGRKGFPVQLSDAIQRVIQLATAVRDYWDAELPKRHPNYPIIRSGDDSGPPPPEEAELRQLFQSLPPEDVYTIMAVMYLGRGDFSPAGLSEERRELKKAFPTADHAVNQMMAKGPLADYLLDGLNALAAAGIDLDTVHLAPA